MIADYAPSASTAVPTRVSSRVRDSLSPILRIDGNDVWPR
jgi:hypothetical protein